MFQNAPNLIIDLSDISFICTKFGAYTIDDYAKDGGPEKSDFYVVFTMSLCALGLKQLLISVLFQIIRL